VTSHIKKSYRKLGAHSAAAAVTRAAELHLL
jgi:DNA-binding CsgD family transcriptional regulator